ncbi:MAG TPA: alanyl-tRNA editing protein [Geminicoccaceae bacterium]|nr:alanyl-tRNA editing protein [Geminicoccaceae bacterium]
MTTEELFRDDAYARACDATVTAVVAEGVVLDRTVFYPTGGGQPGDCGRLVPATGAALPVIDARRGLEPGTVLHLLAQGAEPPPVGAAATAEIDWDRRYRLMRMHSALHLLCAAVGGAVTGGQIGDGRGRLDFDLPEQGVDKEALAERIAGWIRDDRPIRTRWIDALELDRRPELVKTMSVKPPRTGGRVRLVEIEGVDLQACGGTHVRSTGEIGAVLVGKIENKGRRNRRVNLALDG